MEAHKHPELEAQIEELASAVMGPRRSELEGGGRHHEEGLSHKVDELIRLGSEGIKIRLPWQIWAAIITMLGGLVVELIRIWGHTS